MYIIRNSVFTPNFVQSFRIQSRRDFEAQEEMVQQKDEDERIQELKKGQERGQQMSLTSSLISFPPRKPPKEFPKPHNDTARLTTHLHYYSHYHYYYHSCCNICLFPYHPYDKKIFSFSQFKEKQEKPTNEEERIPESTQR